MNYKIDKFKIFTSKEEYLNFRNTWKSFIRQGLHKPYYVEYKRSWLKPNDPNYIEKVKHSPLKTYYHLLYCLLIGKDLNKILEKSKRPEYFVNDLVYLLEALAQMRYTGPHFIKEVKESKPYTEIFEQFLTKERIIKILDEIKKKPE